MAQPAIQMDSLALARRLVDAIESGDSNHADHLIKALHDGRFDALYQEIGKLTRDVHDTFAGLAGDERLVALAQRHMPDARARLNYVVEKTEEAADRTLTAVENMLPKADRLVQEALALRATLGAAPTGRISCFLDLVEAEGQELRASLSEVLMAQEYQDLTGQVIKRTIDLVGQVEEKLVELVAACGVVASGGTALPVANASSHGPAVRDDENVVGRQADVDELLANLGF
ncbi:MAG: protein phosphatase CheZ [Gammaproteobacteria bacterium]